MRPDAVGIAQARQGVDRFDNGLGLLRHQSRAGLHTLGQRFAGVIDAYDGLHDLRRVAAIQNDGGRGVNRAELIAL